MRTLQDVTAKESGAVIYGNDVLVLNWSSVDGLPRLFATGALGLGEDLEALAEHIEVIDMDADEVALAVEAGREESERNGDEPTVAISGAWRIKDALVVTFEGWC